MERIGIPTKPVSSYYSDDQNFFVEIKPPNTIPVPPANARTYNVGTGSSFQYYINKVTGVSPVFVDVSLGAVLQGNRGTFKQLVSDWSVDALTSEGFTLGAKKPGTVTIMHEVMHSLANPNPISGHVTVGRRSANKWSDLMTAAIQSTDNRMLGNPQTFAYLAFGASTPSPFP